MSRWPYNTAQWQRLRLDKLAVEPLCRVCREAGRLVEAQHVDHKRPISDGGDPFPGLDGLDSLCASCHSRKTWHTDVRGAAVPTGLKVDPMTGLPAESGHWWRK